MDYRIGSGVVSGKETVIVESRGSYVDLDELLNSGPEDGGDGNAGAARGGVSLMRMMDDWSYWGEKLPGLVEGAFRGTEDRSGVPGEVGGDEIGWLPPLMYPRKLICVGANYKDHLTEMGVTDLPKYPYTFLKPATTTLLGSGQEIVLPRQAKMVDWEAELAVIIGRRARDVGGEAAMAAVAGYSVLNDVSARDWIAQSTPMGVDWVMQKAFDGFSPMGPLITPARFVPDPQDLNIALRVNGETKQDSNTANMVFSVQEIIEHLAAIMTLEPGDVIATGTPAGVGYSAEPQQFLKPGDTMVVEIEGLGRLETPSRQAS